MAQQTAVEWLSNLIDMQFPSINIKWKEWMIDRAKQMEKKQIIKAYNQDLYGGLSGDKKFDDGEQYYNETYNK